MACATGQKPPEGLFQAFLVDRTIAILSSGNRIADPVVSESDGAFATENLHLFLSEKSRVLQPKHIQDVRM